MRGNPMRAGVERGIPRIGTWVTLVRTPSILMLLKAAGLDFVRIDMERVSTSIESIGEMAAMARALDCPIAVRPPVANRAWITRLLDIGVWNIHCPQVESAEHAAELVAASRYAPWGLRRDPARRLHRRDEEAQGLTAAFSARVRRPGVRCRRPAG